MNFVNDEITLSRSAIVLSERRRDVIRKDDLSEDLTKTQSLLERLERTIGITI